ncbi:MAG TPA: ATP-binding protein [Longimicrobium sp.]|jgi:signal transduction histidine kinase/CRP-like cAMP-binding protein
MTTPAVTDLLVPLREVPLFAGLAEDWLRWLVTRGTEMRLDSGAVAAEQGAEPDGFYVVLEGKISWTRRVGGREAHVVTLGPGSVFGELNLILDEPYATTGRCLSGVRLFRLDSPAFWELIGAVPAVLRQIVQVAADRSRLHAQVSQRMLTDASDVLHSSLDYQTTLYAVACMAVERIADFCLVDVVGPDGLLRTVAAEHADRAERARIREVAVLGAEVTGGVLPHPPEQAPRLEWTAEVDDAWLESRLASAEEAARLRMLSPRSLIIAPMVARGSMLGTLILAISRPDRRFGPDDATLAGELARRAAMAVDNARLYAEAQRAIRARDDILGIVSHDLRNPVGTAQMATGLLLEAAGGGDDDRRTTRKYLDMIRRSMERAQKLINDLLDVTQIDAGRLAVEPGPERPAVLVEEAYDAFAAQASGAGLVLEWEAEPGLAWVAADRARVVQALGNLVANAVKFTPSGGRIVIGARNDADGVCFSVSDTGAGIAPEHLPHLFDRFWKGRSGDRRGAGLGLAIVQGIVAAHGGRVEVESVVGEGTTFNFVLPAAEVRRAPEGRR